MSGSTRRPTAILKLAVSRLEHSNLVIVEQDLSQTQLRRSAILAALAGRVGRIRVGVCNIVVKIVIIVIVVVLGVAFGFFVGVAVAIELFFLLVFLFLFAVF